MPFAPGQSGNQRGAPVGYGIWREAVRRALLRLEAGGKRRRIELLADRLIKEALAGDVAAIKEVGDRIDGKPAQALTAEISGGLDLRWLSPDGK